MGEPLYQLLKRNRGLTFDDIQLIPQYSEIESRGKEFTDISVKLSSNWRSETPFIAAPMDTVCGSEMAIAMGMNGGIGFIHRFFNSIDDQLEEVVKTRSILQKSDYWPPLGAAIGATGDYLERAIKLLYNGVNILLIDVAHGHHANVKAALKSLTNLKNDYRFDIVAGNIATPEAAMDLEEWGVDALRVGIGGGSACETRIRTGVGVPQLYAVAAIREVATVPIISDGGIRYPGDIVKAIAAGADTVMMGNLLGGTLEAPGDIFVGGSWPNTQMMKMFRGSASATAKLAVRGDMNHVEGASKLMPLKGSVVNVLQELEHGLRSALSYVGQENLDGLRNESRFIEITNAGMKEALPHMLY